MGSQSRGTQDDVALEIERARSLQEKLGHQARVMLQTELAVGMTHVRLAHGSRSRTKACHHAAIARQAYQVIIHLSQRIPVRDSPSEQFQTDLGKLKAALQELGEKV